MKVRAKKRDKNIAVAAMALGAFAACQTAPAHADDMSVEIHMLKERLKQLPTIAFTASNNSAPSSEELQPLVS